MHLSQPQTLSHVEMITPLTEPGHAHRPSPVYSIRKFLQGKSLRYEITPFRSGVAFVKYWWCVKPLPAMSKLQTQHARHGCFWRGLSVGECAQLRSSTVRPAAVSYFPRTPTPVLTVLCTLPNALTGGPKSSSALSLTEAAKFSHTYTAEALIAEQASSNNGDTKS